MSEASIVDRLSYVSLTVYLKSDLAEVARVLQGLARQPFRVERFNAHLVPYDVTNLNGLKRVDEPVIRLVIIVAIDRDHDVERLRKILSRPVGVFKVVAVRA